jgi:hypothetical protein
MERVAGIEPACAAWKAAVLPLNYTRVLAILSQPEIQAKREGLPRAPCLPDAGCPSGCGLFARISRTPKGRENRYRLTPPRLGLDLDLDLDLDSTQIHRALNSDAIVLTTY